MIKRNATRIDTAMECLVVSGSSVLHEGSVLTRSLVSGEERVKPSTGLTTDVFVGFSYNFNLPPINTGRVEVDTVPVASPHSITVERGNIITGQTMVRKISDSSILTEVSINPGADEYAVDEDTGEILFNVAEVGDSMRITYRHTISGSEAYYEYPDPDKSLYAAYEMIQSVGVIAEGDVYTDQFNAAIDWDTAIAINMGADGIVTADGAGEEIPNARVVHSPTVSNPFLGISFSKTGYGSESSFSSSSVSSSSISSSSISSSSISSISSSSSSSSISSSSSSSSISSSSSSSSISSSSSSSSISSVSSSSA
jgi:hypothetical protein